MLPYIKRFVIKCTRKIVKASFAEELNRYTETEKQMNQRLDYIREDMNQRFADVHVENEQNHQAQVRKAEQFTSKLEKLNKEAESSDERIKLLAQEMMRLKWKYIDEQCKIKETPEDIVTCKICGHAGKRKDYETKKIDCIFNGGELVRYVCPECGAIFGPTKFSSLSQKDRDADYLIHYIGFSEGDSHEKEMEAFYLLNPTKDKIYLDYGCGCWSKTIEKLRDEGYQIYGYEPYAPETDNPYMITDRLTVSSMRFDGIFSNDVLEHLIDPVEEMKFMKSLLKRPDSMMSHSTACYVYRYAYTRFHTCFYTGKSAQALAEKAGLKIVREVDELADHDFICKVWGLTEDHVDYMPLLAGVGAVDCTGRKVIIHKDGIMTGPYVELGAGVYNWKLRVSGHIGNTPMACRITSNNGEKLLQTLPLVNGENEVTLSLDQPEQRVEITLRNTEDQDLTVTQLYLL